MHHALFVYVEEWDANHSENSFNTFLWNELFWKVLDNVLETLVALFHNDAWKVAFIFDKIDDTNNHWVVETSYASEFSLSCCL